MECPFREVALYCTIFTLVPLRVVSFLMTSSYYFCSYSHHEQQYHYSSTSHAPKVFIQPWTGLETTFLEQPARGWMAFILYSRGYLFTHQTPPLPYLQPREMCSVLKVLLVWKSTGMFTLTLIINILSKTVTYSFIFLKKFHSPNWVSNIRSPLTQRTCQLSWREVIRELKQPRRRQQKPHKFAYLRMKNSIFARFARAFFIFWHFEDVLVLSMTWNDLFCSCVDDMSICWRMFSFCPLMSQAQVPISCQDS